MKPIRLPEPPGSPPSIGGLPDIFEGGVYGVIRRAVIIGNGFPASENQSIGLGLFNMQWFFFMFYLSWGLVNWFICSGKLEEFELDL
ncbi:Hypothetical predicted protein [Olea europaea subsp. europaea]|uniref:Uncharacterized protein n=1 Tax=Olea europaea subsp. europaea TaxID=158383 RepID=A0A8S0T797_OLEEU|nr:Hypothetical predicted protein [Olea europaea subsp. europaea]